MNEVANRLAQSLFKKNTLQECSRWELEILADKYPYFGIAQFLLAGKLRDENEEAYQKQIQKTSLYFTNPLWLDYTLNEQTGKLANPEASNGHAAKQTLPEEHLRFAPVAEETPTEIPVVEQQLSDDAVEEITIDSPETIAEAKIEVEEIPVPEQLIPVHENEPVEEQSVAVINEELEVFSEQNQEVESPLKGNDEALKIAPLKIEPMPAADAPLVFEAFHTVDYFASQGIKLKLEDIPKDRFGQQLKSFTEWLKTIKKVPPVEVAKQVEKATDQKVVTMAEHSLENRDVVTEAMAEVWVKQGKKEKAIEVYNKLSLQNPAKSSYFAALIEQLKQS